FSGLKMIPFCVLLIGAVVLFAPTNLMQATSFSSSSLFSAMPVVLFAFIGIEACSAIIDKVQDSKRVGFKVILTSFVVITAVYAIAQLFIVGMFGQATVNPFLSVLPALTTNTAVIGIGNQFIYTAILISFLGGFYGMFYVNSWNLYTMAQQRSIAGYSWWQRLNQQQTPWVSILFQTFFLVFMLIVTRSNDLLIAMGDLGVLIAYFLTAVAYLRSRPSLLGVLGIITVGVLGWFLLQEVCSLGWLMTLPFGVIFFIGLVMYRNQAAS
ncbi:amino acid permease, partial [Candidatus Dependentiae bacterium]|nr:amino acid permease [Candidatus Dependentiae bacterium]